MQSVAMRIIYKGVFHWFLKLIVGVQFTDCPVSYTHLTLPTIA